jgi:predicted Zn-dependent peptidase
MILINKHILGNGLRVLHSKDSTTNMVAVNLLYNVGARDEQPDKTGFAHLFEHLMFGGSVNVPDFDGPLQKAGAENNAWTNNDITNYYISIPAENLETAFWLESDRMLELDFSQKSLDTQKNVVIEEFKQRNLNQPYGDFQMLLRPLAYKVHPYQWCTIGKDPAHIANATLSEVKDFFYRYYAPNNAILSVVGNIEFDEVVRLAEKWFGSIPARDVKPKAIPLEPVQTEARFLKVERDVPANLICKVYHMPHRISENYVVCDLISDLLSNGNSARLYRSLVQELKLFSEINAYVSGDIDEGLLHVKGKLNEGVSLEVADDAIVAEISKLITEPISDYEMEKVKNKYESNHVFSEMNYLNKATNIAYYELLNRAEDINTEVTKYRAVTQAQVKQIASRLFRPENSSTLYYCKK